MTDQQHPITPPPELVDQIRNAAPHYILDPSVRELYLITAAYSAGADQELEACLDQLRRWGVQGVENLRNTRRPKPKSLAEEALDAIDEEQAELAISNYMVIRRALERLQELEGQGND